MLLEPGIEHAMGEDAVRGIGPAEGEVDAEAVELPDAVYDDDVVLAAICLEPRDIAGGVAVLERGGAKRMEGSGKFSIQG